MNASKIRFRAKVKDSNNWIYRQPFHIRGTWYMYNSLWEMVMIDNRTIGQYVGLHDVNGKEVYEGDILRLEAHQDFFVDIHEGCYVAKSTNQIQRINWLPSALWEILGMGYKVIGNIHDNPELLGGS